MAYMTAVIYARYSSNSQREESIEGQIRECSAFAEKNGYTIIHSYMDRAISGKTDDRPQFQKMIADSKKKLFDTVLVWKLDRFARNRYDSARYKNQLKKNGVRVVSATETISSGAEGILLESMLEGMAEYYSADLAEKVVRGRTENALKCKWNGGTLPIGYIVDEEQHLQPNPLTVCFVVDAYTLYDQGHTLTEVRDYLNSKGVKNSLGRPLTYGSIQHMLNNRRYIGEYIYRDIVTPGGIPAIVPQDLFDRVQERLEKNKKAPARAKAEESYILTTKLFCGHCGVYMCGESGKSRNGVVHRYYKCATAKKKAGDCKKKAVKKEWIENLVVDETMAMIMDDKAIENIVSMFMEIQDRENTTLPVLEKELKETEKAIKNIVSAVEKGMFSEALMHRMEALEAAKADLTVRIEMEKLEKPKISEKEMTFFLHRFRKLNPNIEAHRQILIDTFVNAVYVYDDKLLLTFNFKDGTKTISFADVETATGESGSDINCLGAPYVTRDFDALILKSRVLCLNKKFFGGQNMNYIFPFGQELHPLVQEDQTPKKVFVLGVYASAVHARWKKGNKVISQALAVASEPRIFWDGNPDEASAIIAQIQIPPEVGYLEPAGRQLNGPSAKVLDEAILAPLGFDRKDAWLCDMLPEARLNPNQKRVIEERYQPLAAQYGLPVVTIPERPSSSKPDSFCNDSRCREIIQEIEKSQAPLLVLLGDLPIKQFLRKVSSVSFDSLQSYVDQYGYGQAVQAEINGIIYSLLPLAHPRQIGALGTHSEKWYQQHQVWIKEMSSCLNR